MEKRLAESKAFLPSAQGPEVLCCFGYDVREQLHGNFPNWLVVDSNGEVHQWIAPS